jgi:tetratricopeptide (TPR) repeat protein
LPPGPRRIASRVCPDLISDRHNDPTALWSSGSALGYLAGEIETGIALADHAVVLNPNLAWAWNVGGWLRIYLGEHEEAIERFERAIRLSPLDFTFRAYNGIGWAHLFAGRYEQAASWAGKALLNRPHWAPGAREAAVAYALSGNIAGAKEAMAQLLALDPGLRLSTIGRVAAPWRRAEDRALYLEGLRKAGLPE